MFKHLGLAALSASAVAMAFVACGPEDGGVDISCVSDADCTDTNTICHPDALVCVQTCTSGSDCPESAKTCGAVSDTDSRQICQCATDTLCQRGELGTGAVCQAAWSVCTNACEGDVDCPTGFDCNTTTGQCEAGGSNACNPACGVGQTCDTSSGTPTCVNQSTTCNTSEQQPSACANGQICGTGGTCANIQKYLTSDTACVNFTAHNPTGYDPETWDPTVAANNGPVIYSVESAARDTGWDCGMAGVTNVTARVRAYRVEGEFASSLAGNSGYFYVRTNGTEQSAIPLIRPTSGYTRSTDGKHAEFLVNFCFESSQSQVQVGLYFTNGNAACATLSR